MCQAEGALPRQVCLPLGVETLTALHPQCGACVGREEHAPSG